MTLVNFLLICCQGEFFILLALAADKAVLSTRSALRPRSALYDRNCWIFLVAGGSRITRSLGSYLALKTGLFLNPFAPSTSSGRTGRRS